MTADFPTSQMSTTREQLLLPLAQHPGLRRDSVAVVDDMESGPHVLLIARSAAGEQPKKLTTALENVVRELDPDFQSSAFVTGKGLRQNSINDFLTGSAVAGGAGGVILMLAALGIYGVVGLMVATRTREIAVRAALGASPRRVMGMVNCSLGSRLPLVPSPEECSNGHGRRLGGRDACSAWSSTYA